jgi:hypothetical protein
MGSPGRICAVVFERSALEKLDPGLFRTCIFQIDSRAQVGTNPVIATEWPAR